MIDKIIGFIGAGNMGSAMIGGILSSSLATSSQMIASAHSSDTLEKIKNKFSIETTLSNETVAERSNILFLAVKPNKFSEVIPQISGHIKNSCLVVSIAAGQPIAAIEEAFGKEIKLVRAMPNTPALVGEAMSALCPNKNVTEEELKEMLDIFSCFGKAEVVPESLIDAVVGVSGSSPAYVYLFIEAMADAAVREGIPRKKAYKFAAQAVLGSAKMVLETGMHPGELKDMVCSPAGTTIEAVRVLEEKGLRSAVMEAMKECTKATKSF